MKLCKVCLSHKMDSRDNYIIPEYFEKMNKLIKQIVSNPKYVEKKPTLEDFFEKWKAFKINLN